MAEVLRRNEKFCPKVFFPSTMYSFFTKFLMLWNLGNFFTKKKFFFHEMVLHVTFAVLKTFIQFCWCVFSFRWKRRNSFVFVWHQLLQKYKQNTSNTLKKKATLCIFEKWQFFCKLTLQKENFRSKSLSDL